MSGKDVRINFVDRQASCKAVKNGSVDMRINIPTDEHEQPETDLPPDQWDFVFQKAELTHELGHVLYTDFEKMEEVVDDADSMQEKAAFKNLFNIVEDGAIERQLAAAFNVGNDLRIKNANLLQSHEPGSATGLAGDRREVRFDQAVETILMDWGKYDTGRAEKLLDPGNDEYVLKSLGADTDRSDLIELLPMLRDLCRDVVSEPKGAKRVEIAWDYFQDLWPYTDKPPADPFGDHDEIFPDDVNIHFVKPGEPPEDAEALEPDEDDRFIFVGDPDDPMTSSDEDGDMEMEVEVEGIDGGEEAEDPNVESAKQWRHAANKTGHSIRWKEVNRRGPTNTWDRGQKLASRYEKRLRQALQAERESEMIPNQRAGRPDVQSLWKLGYGDARVFESENKPEEKDYSVVIMLDRSGSMKSTCVRPAEAAAIGLAEALESIGAEVAIISFSDTVALEKPFGVDCEERKAVLSSNDYNGGTPLTKALKLAEARLDQRSGQSLVFAITDGIPNQPDNYKDALGKVTFPVVGAYVQQNGPGRDEIDNIRKHYHRIVGADTDNLSRRVEGLIKRMVV